MRGGATANAPCAGCARSKSHESNLHRNLERGENTMSARRKIEVFSAGCPACKETIEMVNRVACASCEITVLDMQDTRIPTRAKELGIRIVSAVVIDGKLAECRKNRGVDEATLRVAGVGVAA